MKISTDTERLVRRATREAFNMGVAKAGARPADRDAALRTAEDFALGLVRQHVEAEIERGTAATEGAAA